MGGRVSATKRQWEEANDEGDPATRGFSRHDAALLRMLADTHMYQTFKVSGKVLGSVGTNLLRMADALEEIQRAGPSSSSSSELAKLFDVFFNHRPA